VCARDGDEKILGRDGDKKILGVLGEGTQGDVKIGGCYIDRITEIVGNLAVLHTVQVLHTVTFLRLPEFLNMKSTRSRHASRIPECERK
jgi:hypothetical protein